MVARAHQRLCEFRQPPTSLTFLQTDHGVNNFSFPKMNGTQIKLNQTIYEETRNETRALLDSGASGIFGPIEDVSMGFVPGVSAQTTD